jgi:hypothetical protein
MPAKDRTVALQSEFVSNAFAGNSVRCVSMGNWKITGLGVVALSLAASAAAAEEPFTANKGQLGAQLMYGVDLEEGDLNPYGLGLAPQGGYTLGPGIYLGGRFDYFFGGSDEAAGLEVSLNIYQFLFEAGYDVGLTPNMVLRPKLGVGLGWGSAEACMDGVCADDESDTELALSPGANFLVELDPVYLNFDARYNAVMSDPEAIEAFVIGAGVGLTL